MISVEKVTFFEEIRKEVTDLLRLNETLTNSGLLRIVPQEERSFAGFPTLIKGGRRLTVVVNYGKDWVSNWRAALVAHLQQTGSETDWFMLNPESQFCATLSAKQKADPSELRTKIDATRRDLEVLYRDHGGQGTLRIFWLDYPVFPMYSIFLSEARDGPGQVAITLYSTASRKSPVPLFLFEEVAGHTTVYNFIRDDIARLKQDYQPCVTVGPQAPA
jgi:hypothetical protein